MVFTTPATGADSSSATLRKDGSVYVPSPGDPPAPAMMVSGKSREEEEWDQIVEQAKLEVAAKEIEIHNLKVKTRQEKMRIIMANLKMCKDLNAGFSMTLINDIEPYRDPLLGKAIRDMGLTMHFFDMSSRPGDSSSWRITIKKTPK